MATNNGSRQRVIALLKEGLTPREVAIRTGLRPGTISGYAAWGRAQGQLSYRTKGRPELVISRLPPEVLVWLREQTPEGAAVEDTIRAIVVDAYHEERPDAG